MATEAVDVPPAAEGGLLPPRFTHESRLDESVGIKKDRHQSMPITHTSRNGKNYYDCISIGPAERIDKLAAKYLKYLGQDSMCELF